MPPPLVAPIAIRPMGSAGGLGIVNNKRKLFVSSSNSCGPPQKSPKIEISPVSTPTNSSGCHEGFGKRMCIPPPPAPPTPASKRRISRKLAFDEDKTSPVSGTIIRELAEGEEIPVIKTGENMPKTFEVTFSCIPSIIQVTLTLSLMSSK